MKRLIIPGRLPGLNDYIDAERASRYKGAKVKREAEELVIWQARAQLRGYRAKSPVRMRYRWVERNRCRDKDNISGFGRKVIQDALVRCGVLPDDGWAWVLGFSDDFSVSRKNPRIEVELEEVGGND